MHKRTPFMLCALLIGFAMANAGCIRRTITVQTEPPGALVYLNDEEVGRSPVTVPFMFYGLYDVRLEKEGFATLQTEGLAVGPWWEWPIVDLLAELGPDRYVKVKWHYPLKKIDQDSTEGLLDRANQIRQKLPQP